MLVQIKLFFDQEFTLILTDFKRLIFISFLVQSIFFGLFSFL